MKYLLVTIGSLFVVINNDSYTNETILERSDDREYLANRALSLKETNEHLDSLDGYYSDSEFEKTMLLSCNSY